jgi:hypothetical protein
VSAENHGIHSTSDNDKNKTNKTNDTTNPSYPKNERSLPHLYPLGAIRLDIRSDQVEWFSRRVAAYSPDEAIDNADGLAFGRSQRQLIARLRHLGMRRIEVRRRRRNTEAKDKSLKIKT